MTHALATPIDIAQRPARTRKVKAAQAEKPQNVIEREHLTVKQAALQLEVTPSKIKQLADSGILRCAVNILSTKGIRLRYFKPEDLNTPIVKKHVFLFKAKKLNPYELAESCGQQRISFN